MTSHQFLLDAYAKLHPDRHPYAWQEQLFERIILNDFPEEIAAPTGSGKTSLISLWLIGLAWQARYAPPVRMPRRLVWVVNRRVVVDQATREATELRQRLINNGELSAILAGLCLGSCEVPLAISTLRGEFADNREWVEDPSRPAIVIGTVDMIGSRLLFSGYGDSFKTRPHHAGLLGHDTLIVNDEAHLTPAFASLLQQIASKTSVRTISLSATLDSANENRYPPNFDEDVGRTGEFSKRFQAPKWLRLHEASNNRDAQSKAVELAAQNPAPRTIVFVTRPEDAAAIASSLRKRVGDSRVLVLTGTQRGDYRDRMARSAEFGQLTKNSEPQEPTWLVSTAAGEVGLDASCTRLITFLDTADHLIQRLGRLNRFGETTGEAHLVYVPPKEKQAREVATLEYVRSLPSPEQGVYDVSARSLFEHQPPKEAMTERPAEAPLTGWVIDRWSLTTAGRETKPKVELWLHGKQDDLAETHVAWRADIKLLVERKAPHNEIEKALRMHPLRAAELLREPTYQLLKKLERWLAPEGCAILRSDGTIRYPIGDWRYEELAYSTLLLPPNAGGLEDGMFSRSAVNGDDIADEPANGQPERARYIAKRTDEGFEIAALSNLDAPEPILSLGLADLRDFLRRRGMTLAYTVDLSDENADETELLVVYARRKGSPDASEDVPLADHAHDVARFAKDILEKLGSDQDLQSAYKWAGLHHDAGKATPIWRRAMNCEDGEPLAKTGRRRTRPTMLEGFRHELASLGEAAGRDDVSEEHRDLALHLIACHHGYARPFFYGKACGPENDLAEAAREATRRFARLQQRYGPWKLAYLEALFRAADWLASKGKTPVDGESQDD